MSKLVYWPVYSQMQIFNSIVTDLPVGCKPERRSMEWDLIIQGVQYQKRSNNPLDWMETMILVWENNDNSYEWLQ